MVGGGGRCDPRQACAGVTEMARCPHCEFPIPDDRERAGARCSHCHDPLYEPATRFPRPAREGKASCVLHAGMEAVGVCLRCGNNLCETCRTRWQGQILCARCVDRALSKREATPGQRREQEQQAWASLYLGGVAWVAGGLILLLLGRLDPPGSRGGALLSVLALGLLACNVLVAALGTGQALAALRSGADARGPALWGLVVAGLYMGVSLGVAVLGLWQN